MASTLEDLEIQAVIILMLKDKMTRKAIINYAKAFVGDEEWEEALKVVSSWVAEERAHLRSQ
jgi:hypothetical protein